MPQNPTTAKSATEQTMDLRNTTKVSRIPHHDQGMYVWRQQVSGHELNHTSIDPQQKAKYAMVS